MCWIRISIGCSAHWNNRLRVTIIVVKLFVVVVGVAAVYWLLLLLRLLLPHLVGHLSVATTLVITILPIVAILDWVVYVLL